MRFEHCTFSNISFKDCNLTKVEFENCVFIGCYFRQTRIENSAFSACRFLDCDFTKLDLRTSDLKFYNRFKRCWIERRVLEHTLPQEPNLRHHLCANLANEARLAGALRDAEWYAQQAAKAGEKHLWAAVSRANSYYREKFNGTERIGALVRYLASKGRGWMWGYRRSFLVVGRNWAFVALILFPLLYLWGSGGLTRPDGAATWTDAWLASIQLTVPGQRVAELQFTSGYTQMLALAQAAVSLVFGGLVVALLFRSVFERWR